jgi:GGDEF domain-containing protein
MNLAVQNHTPLSCLMIDIDHFKAINDRYGHEAGDLVIKSVRRLFNARCAISAWLSATAARSFWCCWAELMKRPQWCASEIYTQVRNMTLRDGLTEIGQMDVSIGIASYPQHTQSDSLLRAADAALYRAKELGRSRIVSFGSLKTD